MEGFEYMYKKENKEKPIFFDRGFLDTLCYATIIQSEVDMRMKSYAENWRYNKSVFILPPWREIYETDSERKQDWNEAVMTYNQMAETYRKYGYEVVEIPKESVSKRANFIVDFIEKN